MDPETFEFLGTLEREHANMVSNDSIVPRGERECPTCKQPMRVKVEHGIHLDQCDHHGVWLDRGELPAIISRIRSGEFVSRMRATKGRYSQLEVNRGLPARLLVKYFRQMGSDRQICDQLRMMVEFRTINLAATGPALPSFDIPFLRNLLVYFDQSMCCISCIA